MLPLQQAQTEKRPKVAQSGSANLVIPPRQDAAMLSFEEYEDMLPKDEELVPYAEPVTYWNPIDPGSYIKPYPSLPSMHDQNGLCVCWNKAEEDAWRTKLSQYSGGNPDKWKGDTGDYLFECETCHFATRNAVAWTDHIRYWKHK